MVEEHEAPHASGLGERARLMHEAVAPPVLERQVGIDVLRVVDEGVRPRAERSDLRDGRAGARRVEFGIGREHERAAPMGDSVRVRAPRVVHAEPGDLEAVRV